MSVKLTAKQLEILRLLYLFRFLNRYQIQSLLHHKSKTRVNTWLAELVESELVGRNYSQKFGENTNAAVYYLNVKSKNFLSSLEGFSELSLRRVYRERGRSKRFINHCITVGDVYIYLNSLEKDKLLQFLTKVELNTTEHLIQPVPDAYFAIEKPDKIKYRFFLEVFDLGVPRYAIRKRIMDYVEYAESQKWEEATTHEFPSVLCACPNDWVKNYLYRLTKALQKDEELISFYLVNYGIPDKKNFWQKVN